MPEVIAGFNIAKNEPADIKEVAVDEDARYAIFWVFKGLKVYQVDTGITYKCNVDAVTQTGGPPWTEDADWEAWMPAAGSAGADGSLWHRGGGDPVDTTGANGDFFLQTHDGDSNSEGDIYQKAAGTWGSPIFNIKGAAGADAVLGYFGGLSVEDNSAGTPQTIGTSFVQVDQFDTDGLAQGTTPAHASDNITIDNTGVMQFSASLSFSGTTGVDYYAKIFVDAVEIDGFTSKVTIHEAGDIKVLKIDGIYSFTATEVVDIRVKTSAAGSDFLVHEGSFTVASMGTRGADSAVAGENFHVDLADVYFREVDRAGYEALGSSSDRYVLTVQYDDRDGADRTAGPAILNFNLTNWIIATDGTDWFLYGQFRGKIGTPGADATVAGAPGKKGATQTVPGATGPTGGVGNKGPSGDELWSTGPTGPTGATGLDGPDSLVMGPAGQPDEFGYKNWAAPGSSPDYIGIHYGSENVDTIGLYQITKWALYTKPFRPTEPGYYKIMLTTHVRNTSSIGGRHWMWVELQRWIGTGEWIYAQEWPTKWANGKLQVRQDIGPPPLSGDPIMLSDVFVRELAPDVYYRFRIWISHQYYDPLLAGGNGGYNNPAEGLNGSIRNQGTTVAKWSDWSGITLQLLTPFIDGTPSVDPPDDDPGGGPGGTGPVDEVKTATLTFTFHSGIPTGNKERLRISLSGAIDHDISIGNVSIDGFVNPTCQSNSHSDDTSCRVENSTIDFPAGTFDTNGMSHEKLPDSSNYNPSGWDLCNYYVIFGAQINGQPIPGPGVITLGNDKINVVMPVTCTPL